MAKDVATRLKERLRLRRRSRSRSRSRSSNRRRIDGEAEEEEEVEEEEEEGNAVAEEICKESEEDDGDDDANKGEHGGNCCMDPSPHQDALPNGPRGSCPVQTRQMSTCGGPRDHQNPEDNRKSSTKKTEEEEEEEEERLKKRKSALEIDQIGSAAAAEDATGERVIYSSSDKEKDSLIPQGIATKKPMLEAFDKGAWWDVELLAVQKGSFLLHFLGYGDKEVPFPLVRHRLRRAYDHDCSKFFEPGIDVAVYSTLSCASDTNNDCAWYDGKLISINRRGHDPRCTCEFEVQLYSANEDEILQLTNPRTLIPGSARYYHINHLGILQKPHTSGLSGVQREMRSEARVWSVDTKYLPSNLGNGREEPAAKKTVKRICVIAPAKSTNCPTLDGKSKICMRARGVDIKDTPEQPQEVNLLRVMTVEETGGNVSDQFACAQEACPSYKEHQCVAEELKSKMKPKATAGISAQNKSKSNSCKPNTYSGAFLMAQAPRKLRKKWCPDQNKNIIKHNQAVKERCLVQNITNVQPQHVIHGRIGASEENAGSAILHVKRKHVCQSKGNNEAERRSELLSSMIGMVVCIKRKGWQCKLFFLLSRGLRNNDIHSHLQHEPPHCRSKDYVISNSSQHGQSSPAIKRCAEACRAQISRISTKIINECSRKRKGCESSETVRKPRKIRVSMENCMSSAKEFVKKVLETASSGDPKLDWNNLRSQKLSSKAPPIVDVSVHKTPSVGKNLRNKYRPRNPVHKTRKCTETLDNVSAWIDGWSFKELFGIRDDNQNPDRTVMPFKLKTPEVGWDPMIFHDSAENIDEVKKAQGDPLEYIWQDMESALDKGESSDIMNDHIDRTLMGMDPLGCDGCHDFIIEEEEGLLCRTCGLVACSIELMLPPVIFKSISMQYHVRKAGPEDAEREFDISLKLGEDGATDFLRGKTDDCLHAGIQNSSVWDLIPELKKDMHDHQKDGFEFLWHNLVGSIGPSSEEGNVPRETGGCIISHAPGTGKTFLIISFLKSYLKLNPNCRPLILAPTIMLWPWQREFKKWNVDIPVHILNTSLDSRRKRVFPDVDETKTFTLQSGSKISTKNIIHLHRMQVLSKWHEEESILISSYALFSRLTDHESPRVSAFSGSIGKLLQQRPGLLILDEGHLARNHESKLRKSLMQVKTKLRILLSGTIFQNNCCELFNTFHLVRPTFMKDMFQSEGNYSPYSAYCGRGRPPKASYANLRRWKSSTESTATSNKCSVKDDSKAELDQGTDDGGVESHNRRLFMEKIGKTLENGQRKRGKLLDKTINKLRSMTQSFVHYYTGEILKSLPGLSDFTIFLKPSPVQERLLNEIAKVWDRKSTLELEYVVSNICIHPHLFKVMSGKEGCANVDLGKVGDLVANPQESTKVSFIMGLLHLCQEQNEKLLIFSQNITPLQFLDDLLQSDSKFLLKGERVMKLHGSLPLDDRQTVIDCFNKADGNVRVLLASTKACGEGITLTGASRVVFLDILWNPAVMKQAMSRAFRLGQKKEVFVYRLVASGTLEEDKYKRTIWKDWLSRCIFESSVNWENSSTPAPHLSSPSPKDSVAAKGKESMENDVMLATLIEHDKEYKSIMQVVKHDGCLDQGDISSSDMEDCEMEGNNES